ncbi:valine--tRNA ligase [Clostridia bacterium]|nr:valine--tRNA ligase [Clostridia bacterium]
MEKIEMDKQFTPGAIEREIYETWESTGAFTPTIDHTKKPFTIMMPPPNITGQLHSGHAMVTTYQDILARFHRMLGEPTLWLPGTDHASIATEVKILDALREEGLTKEDLGREEFLKRAWEWKETYGGTIVQQLRRMGASCDWTRERFTMDAGLNKAVTEVFVKLYEKGLIYRADRIINWCPECNTALSDAEVEYEVQTSNLWYIRYPAADGSDGVVVATTRPETMLGDTGVAVNPNDERYTHLVGKSVIMPILNRTIPVVADDYVEMEFGTGAVKMTPAHDPNDFEVAKRHNLAVLRVMNDDGSMNEAAGAFAGKSAKETRKLIVDELERLGLLVKVEPYTHNVGICYRCSHTVEPLVSLQWFVDMKPLAVGAIDAVETGKTRFIPPRFKSIYDNWMYNIRDWCISRHLWWGHRIPAYYCQACGETIVARAKPAACPKCQSTNITQDEDVLDTWFSSALWPFSTLGWPDDTEDLTYFYPTSVLVTAYDIIFFWVARMIFSGVYNMGEPPFHTVVMHGLVRDALGRKMSKSLGNGIDPLKMIDKYGADALRLSLTIGVAPGNDQRLSDDKIESARNFANKLWNASRFVSMNIPDDYIAIDDISDLPLTTADKWILTRFAETSQTVTERLQQCDLGLAAQEIHDFTWNLFCDWTIELSKPALFGDDAQAKRTALAVLLYVLDGILKLLHPFMPYITEKVYGMLPLPSKRGMLIHAEWPKPSLSFPEEAAAMDEVIAIVRAVRALRLERNVAPSKRVHIALLPAPRLAEELAHATHIFTKLAGASGVTILSDRSGAPSPAAKTVTASSEIFLPLSELIDYAQERARLAKAREAAERDIERVRSKLDNQGFLDKAPAKLVNDERAKLETLEKVLETLITQEREL